MRQRVSKWYKYWLDVPRHILFISGFFTASRRGINYAQGRLADASRTLTTVGRSNCLRRPLHNCGLVHLTWPAGRPGNLPIIPTATPPLS